MRVAVSAARSSLSSRIILRASARARPRADDALSGGRPPLGEAERRRARRASARRARTLGARPAATRRSRPRSSCERGTLRSRRRPRRASRPPRGAIGRRDPRRAARAKDKGRRGGRRESGASRGNIYIHVYSGDRRAPRDAAACRAARSSRCRSAPSAGRSQGARSGAAPSGSTGARSRCARPADALLQWTPWRGSLKKSSSRLDGRFC